jgi:hypothetical protein
MSALVFIHLCLGVVTYQTLFFLMDRLAPERSHYHDDQTGLYDNVV